MTAKIHYANLLFTSPTPTHMQIATGCALCYTGHSEIQSENCRVVAAKELTMESYSELFEIAVKIEKQGRDFYQQAAGQIQDKVQSAFFSYLAEEEAKHAVHFAELGKNLQTIFPTDALARENLSFLKAFVKSVVFAPQRIDERDALADLKAIIRFAMQRETESILYYEEIKRLFAKQADPLLDQIIQEEIQHYLKLSQMEENL